MVCVQRNFERDNGAILNKNFVQFCIDHVLGYIFDKNLSIRLVGLFLDLPIVSEGPALFAVQREVPDALTGLEILLLRVTFYLDEPSIKHLLGIPLDDWRLLDNDSSLLFKRMCEFLGRK